MVIVCIDNSKVEANLKMGVKYEVYEETKKLFKIILGNGVKGSYRKERFREVK